VRAFATEKVYDPAETERKRYDTWIKACLFYGEKNSEKPPFSMTLPPTGISGTSHTTTHTLTFTIPDIILRRKKMQGYNTVWVSSLDRSDSTSPSERQFIDQLNRLGLALDRDRDTPFFGDEMQKAVTGIFVQLFKKGEIYRSSMRPERETTEKSGPSSYWILKTSGFIAPAVEVVEKGEINFIPGKWKKEYSRWIADTGNRRISRPGTLGHRIPAYHCRSCGRIEVEEEAPAACSNCGSTSLYQDPDVLDTWFTAALWPVIALSGKDNISDFTGLYPSALFAGGFDAVFTRVAWMIMMGVRFGSSVPFKEVLFTGLVRDEKGRIIGKIKSNITDPLELMDKYGADALRFTLAVRAVPGVDISLSAGRVKGYKAFVKNMERIALCTYKPRRQRRPFHRSQAHHRTRPMDIERSQQYHSKGKRLAGRL
jgi:valyl-tRNA synthetase